MISVKNSIENVELEVGVLVRTTNDAVLRAGRADGVAKGLEERTE